MNQHFPWMLIRNWTGQFGFSLTFSKLPVHFACGYGNELVTEALTSFYFASGWAFNCWELLLPKEELSELLIKHIIMASMYNRVYHIYIV